MSVGLWAYMKGAGQMMENQWRVARDEGYRVSKKVIGERWPKNEKVILRFISVKFRPFGIWKRQGDIEDISRPLHIDLLKMER